MVQWLTNPTRNHKFRVRSLALLSGLRIRLCRELWCRLQTRLGSHIAVALAQAGSYSSDSTLAWEPPYAVGVALEKAEKKKKRILAHIHTSRILREAILINVFTGHT